MYRVTNRVVGFEVVAETRAVDDYVIDKGTCARKADLTSKNPLPLEINDKGILVISACISVVNKFLSVLMSGQMAEKYSDLYFFVNSMFNTNLGLE